MGTRRGRRISSCPAAGLRSGACAFLHPVEADFLPPPYAQLVAFVEVEVRRRALDEVRFLEEGHDGRILLVVETAFQVVELRDGFVVQVAVLVPFEQGHGELVHRVVRPVVLALYPALEEVDESGGGSVGPLVEAFDLVAFHLNLEVPILDGETHLPLAAELAVVRQGLPEGCQFVHTEGMEGGHFLAKEGCFLLEALHQFGADALVGVAVLEAQAALLFLFLLQ